MMSKYIGRFLSLATDDGIAATNAAGEQKQEAAQASDDAAQPPPPAHATYDTYLMLPTLLILQRPLGEQHDVVAPDEHFFIVIHQTFELWFKQLLVELDIVFDDLRAANGDAALLSMTKRVARMCDIFRVLTAQLVVLESMSALDFLDFREYFGSSSGFQSRQFRLLENRLGVAADRRIEYEGRAYWEPLCAGEQTDVRTSENEASLFTLVERWLERTPGLHDAAFAFWARYRDAVDRWLDGIRDAKLTAAKDDERALEAARGDREAKGRLFDSLFDPAKHEELVAKGDRRFSHDALKGALMVLVYCDRPRFYGRFEFIKLLMDLGSLVAKWRYTHVMIVHRMLGNKPGSGGSSGYLYLRSTCSDRYRVFVDLFNVATFLIPRRNMPSPCERFQRFLAYEADDDEASSLE